MSHPIEQIMADAIVGMDLALAEARITCNLWASSRMVCRCGRILDQEKVTVLETSNGGLNGACDQCVEKDDEVEWARIAAKLREIFPGITVTKHTWEGRTVL